MDRLKFEKPNIDLAGKRLKQFLLSLRDPLWWLKQVSSFLIGMAILNQNTMLLKHYPGWNLRYQDQNTLCGYIAFWVVAFLIGKAGFVTVHEFLKIKEGRAKLQEWFNHSVFMINSHYDRDKKSGKDSPADVEKAERVMPLLELIEFMCSKIPCNCLYSDPSVNTNNGKYLTLTDQPPGQYREELKDKTILAECLRLARGHRAEAPKILYYSLLQTLIKKPSDVIWKVAVWKTTTEEMGELTKLIRRITSSKNNLNPDNFSEFDTAVLTHYLYHLKQLYPQLMSNYLTLIYIQKKLDPSSMNDFEKACKVLVGAFRSAVNSLNVDKIYIISGDDFAAGLRRSNIHSHGWNFGEEESDRVTDYHALFENDGHIYSIAALPDSVEQLSAACEIAYRREKVKKRTYATAEQYLKESKLGIDLRSARVLTIPI